MKIETAAESFNGANIQFVEKYIIHNIISVQKIQKNV